MSVLDKEDENFCWLLERHRFQTSQTLADTG